MKQNRMKHSISSFTNLPSKFYRKRQISTKLSSVAMSRFRSLLFLSMADRRPLSIQESTYFVGSNSFRGGPTSLTKSREEMVFVSNDARDGVAIRFICENPRSHSLEEIGIVDRACCSGINLSEHFFSTKYSRKPRITSLSAS